MRRAIRILLLFLVMAVSLQCNKDRKENYTWAVRKIAVVLPMDFGQRQHWVQTVEVAATGIQEVQKGNILNIPGEPDPALIKMEFEWYDEEKEDLEALAERLAARDDIVAVIGGYYSAHASILATHLCRARKPFFTIATTDELVRAYSATGSLWAMVESDITQCEVLLSRALYYGANTVSLIADGSSLYGKTFVDWFGFQATELGLEVGSIYDYSIDGLANTARAAAKDKADVMICVPSTTLDVSVMENNFRVGGGTMKRLYSDTAYGQEIIDRFGPVVEGIEGVTFGASPESGFDIFYEIKFGSAPTHGAPQIYDAVLMLGWALIDQIEDGGMQPLNYYLKAEATAGIAGACGTIEFDHVVFTNVLSTTYQHYMLYQGQYIILDYISSNGSHRSDATLGAWSWKAEQMQDFEDEEQGGTPDNYPALDQKWALLVAGSSEWKNYRHQADVLEMYQILKHHGYDDDHIVLIAEDDLAYNSMNPEPGVVRVRPQGANVHEGVVIDYKTSQLVPSDIQRILLGQKSANLPAVIEADANDNIIIFWSGHGQPGQMMWLERTTGFTAELAEETFLLMESQKKYRKMLCLIETCYSGSVMSTVEGRRGILAFTAAGPNETSKADVYNEDMGIWMSNRFSATLEDCINNTPDIPFRDLYYRLFTNTVGSHVMVYNASNYGNIYRETMMEYL